VSDRVLLRAASGPDVGMGHAMRTRAVAQALAARGARAGVLLDDAATAAHLTAEGLDARAVEDGEPWWEAERDAPGVWIDGFRNFTPELVALGERGVPRLLVENRTGARDHCETVVYPALHHLPDEWDRVHAERVLAGAEWTPLAREVLDQPEDAARDVDLLVSFGGSDPGRLTERSLAALAGFTGSVRVLVGPHMGDRRAAIERQAAELADADVLRVPGHPAACFARARVALTALGTSLYELAYLRVPALILANYATDLPALAYYARLGPHRPLGVAGMLDDDALADGLRRGIPELGAEPGRIVPRLGPGADRLAALLLGQASERPSSS
jgi:spore coat polysaccharide biosynthesis predicted glycosyltransferase SpsG